MIVLCPACRTRFRTPSVPESAALVAVCSRCDEQFRLAPVKRTYVLRPPAPARSLEAAVEAGPAPAALGPADRPARGGARSPFVESLIALLPAVAGAGLAYDLAGRSNQDTIAWAALGGAVGLLLGWACLLWIGRKD
jgi:hypothetical protein